MNSEENMNENMQPIDNSMKTETNNNENGNQVL